jgi:flavodoxin
VNLKSVFVKFGLVLLLGFAITASYLVGQHNSITPVNAYVSSSPDWEVVGGQTTAEMGGAVNSAGDVNGDGFQDIIVSADRYTNGQSLEGRVFIYYGSPSGVSISADWTFESDVANALFGRVASYAGDLNSDGYDDIVIGARGWNNSKGKVYVFYGSSTGLDSSPDWVFEGENNDDRLGAGAASAGDINDDGYDDLIVGAWGFDDDCCSDSLEGKLYVFLGSDTGLESSPDWTYIGTTNSALGSVVASADVNGDGYSDIIAAASLYTNGSYLEGQVVAFYGSSIGLDSSPDWAYESNFAGAKLGTSVARAGDVNADGYDDIIIGAPWEGYGKVYVFHGSSTGLDSSPDWTKTSNASSQENFGFSVNFAGDVNADGYDDIVVGAPTYSLGEIWEAGWQIGRVFIFKGSSSGPNSTAYWSRQGDTNLEQFGRAVATAGHPTQANVMSVIVGAVYHEDTAWSEGRAVIFYGQCD